MSATFPPEEALHRLIKLLEAEGVTILREKLGVRSLHMPLPLINLDRRLYSKRNWVGINPFVLLTGLRITVSASKGGALINVSIDRGRMVALLLFAVLVVVSVAFQAPPLLILVVVATGFLSVCGVLLRWGYTLTRKEIEKELRL